MIAKRAKLFAAMHEAGAGDMLPSLSDCTFAPVYQFALALDRILQTHLRPRLALLPNAADAPHVARAVLTQFIADNHNTGAAEVVFAKEVLAFVDADAARKEPWPQPPLVMRDDATAIEEWAVDAPPLSTLPSGRLRFVMTHSRAMLLDFNLLAGPVLVVQRDCIYQTLIFLHGLLGKHTLFANNSRTAFEATLQAKRGDMLQQFRNQWAAASEAEERARADVVRALETEPATWEVAAVAAEQALLQSEKAIETATAEMERVRAEVDAHFVEDGVDASTRDEWVKLCGMRQQFWAQALERARTAVVTRRASAVEARARMAQNAEAHSARMEKARLPLPTREQMEALVMAHVDVHADRLRTVAAWCSDRARYCKWLEQMAQHGDVLADAHLTVCARAQKMLGK